MSKQARHTYTMDRCSAIKRSEVLTPVTIGTDLKNMMLSERHQSSETMYHVIPLIRNAQPGGTAGGGGHHRGTRTIGTLPFAAIKCSKTRLCLLSFPQNFCLCNPFR